MVYVLENALRITGVALIRDNRGYRLIPSADAVGSGSVDVARGRGGPEAGYGITVIPLYHLSAPNLLKLLDSFAAKSGSIRAEPGRNLLVVQGSSAERRSVLETVLSFDADWMRGQSVGIYPVQNSTPEPIISELEKIMDAGEGGLSHNLVKLQAIGRLNAILVVAAKPNLLRTAQTWIARLDRADTTMTGVRVYRVRYGEAKQLAGLLNDIFVGGRGAGVADTATNQIAPGGSSVVQSSIDRSVPGQPGLRISGARTQPGAPPIGQRQDAVAPDSGTSGSQGSTGARGGDGGQGMLPGIRITADVVNNTLLIYANQESYRIIERTLRQLDRPQLQVAIEATIAEVTLNNEAAATASSSSSGAPTSAWAATKGSIGLEPVERGLRSADQPGSTWVQFPDRQRATTAPDPGRPAGGHRRKSAVDPFARGAGQSGGDAAGRRPGAGRRPAPRPCSPGPNTPWSTASIIATPASSCASCRASTSTAM